MYKSISSETHDNTGNLALRLRRREPGALSDLYDIYGRILYALIVRMVPNPALAEDLVQETFLRAWNRASQLDENREAIGPWLIAIARRCALDYLKSVDSQHNSSVQDDRRLGSIAEDHELSASGDEWLTVAAFNGLSENQKSIIQLFPYEGVSHSTIANKLNHPLATIMGWARSAFSWLRRILNYPPSELMTRG